MSKTPFMPLWVADFLADTQDLDGQEVGAYMLLLMSMWQRDGRLPSDQKKLQRVARIGRNWPKIWRAIECYFDDDGTEISNRRLTEELTKARTKSSRAATSGARGGRAKALKNNDPPLANATNSLKQPEPESEKEEINSSFSADELAAGDRYEQRQKSRRLDHQASEGNVVPLSSGLEPERRCSRRGD